MIAVMKKTIVRFTLALGLLLLSQGVRAQTFTYWTEENGPDYDRSIVVADFDYSEIILEAALVSYGHCACDDNERVDILRDGAGEYIYYFDWHSPEEGSEAYVRIIMFEPGSIVGDDGTVPVIDYIEVVNPADYECCQIFGGKYVNLERMIPDAEE